MGSALLRFKEQDGKHAEVSLKNKPHINYELYIQAKLKVTGTKHI